MALFRSRYFSVTFPVIILLLHHVQIQLWKFLRRIPLELYNKNVRRTFEDDCIFNHFYTLLPNLPHLLMRTFTVKTFTFTSSRTRSITILLLRRLLQIFFYLSLLTVIPSFYGSLSVNFLFFYSFLSCPLFFFFLYFISSPLPPFQSSSFAYNGINNVLYNGNSYKTVEWNYYHAFSFLLHSSLFSSYIF